MTLLSEYLQQAREILQEDARKVLESLWDAYRATDVLVVNGRRVDFSLSE